MAGETIQDLFGDTNPSLSNEDLEPNFLQNSDIARENETLGFLINSGTGAPQEPGLKKVDPFNVRGAAVKGALPVAADVAQGVLTEVPTALISGARDAIQGTLDAADSLGDFLNKNVLDLGSPRIFNKEGEFDPGVDFDVPPEETGVNLPEPPRPESVTGNVMSSITQFLVGFVGAGKLPGVGFLKSTPLTQAAVKGAIADLTVFGEHEERLSNLIQDIPVLANPVTEFLQADPNDSAVEGRLKNAIEGLGLGAVADGLFRAVKAVRSARVSKSVLEAAGGSADELTGAVRFQSDTDSFIKAVGDPDDVSETVVTKVKGIDTGVPDDVAAKGLTRVAHTPTDDSLFVNFARIDTEQDVKDVIGQMADAFKPDIDSARRGVRTNAQTIADAADIDAFNELMKRPDAQPLNAETTFAVRELWASSGRKLMETAKAAATNPSAENLFAFRKMMATHHAIQSEVIAARTETARALQSWRIPAGANSRDLKALEDAISQAGGGSVNAELATRIATLGETGGVGMISKNIEKSVYATTRDAVQEYWINAILSGPKTHLVNMISNTSIIGLNLVERASAGRLAKLLGEEGVEIGEAMATTHGMAGSIKEAFRHSARVLRDEFRLPGTEFTPEFRFGQPKIEIGRQPAISSSSLNIRNDTYWGRTVDSIGNTVRAPGAALTAEDEFFKTFGYRGEVHALAFRQVEREIKAGITPVEMRKSRMQDIIDNPPENIRLAAIDQAQYQTFTAQGSAVAKAIQKGTGRFPMLRFLIPFVNTPDNIIRYAFERTPLAPAMTQYRDAIAAGGARKHLAQSRMALGTGMMMVGMDMSFNGMLTGSGPTDRDELAALKRSGWQPYSIRVGDRFFAYNRLDPVGFTFGVTADLAEFLDNVDWDEASSVEFSEVSAALTASIAQNMTNKTYFTGATDFIEAMSQPDSRFEAWQNRFAGSFVPNIVKEAARFIDPNMRMTSNMTEALRRGVPVLSKDLPAARDLWGRPRQYRSGIKPDAVGMTWDMISPIYSKKFKPEPIDQEMMKERFFIRMPSKRMSFNGVPFNLRNAPEIYSRFLELRGNALKVPSNGNLGAMDFLNQVVSGKHRLSAAYANLPDAQSKEDFVKKVLRAYGGLAKQQLLQEFPQIGDAVEQNRGTSQDVVLP